MSELWIKKSTTDVHRLIDNKLPPGSVCTGVTMKSLDDGAVEEFVAMINGAEVIVEAPVESSADDVASEIVKGAPEPPEPEPEPLPAMDEPTAENAAMEGAEVAEEYEYDDSDDDDDEDDTEDVSAAPKSKKSKSKTKKK